MALLYSAVYYNPLVQYELSSLICKIYLPLLSNGWTAGFSADFEKMNCNTEKQADRGGGV